MAGVGIIVNRSHGVQQCSRRRGKNQARAGAARRSVRVRSCVKSVPSRRVLVTGAGGRTGRLVLEKLARRDNGIEAVGFVRSLEKADELLKLVGDTEIFVGDITEMASMEKAFKDADALVILTSAVPHMISPGPPPKFSFNEMMMPERVDWQGQKAQIDLAKAGKLKHVVLVGSRGGTDENHMLNKIGDGNILIWKRKSEQYLVDSGVNYTIVRAGGLLDQVFRSRALSACVCTIQRSHYRSLDSLVLVPHSSMTNLCP